MAHQYFEDNQDLDHDYKIINFNWQGQTLHLKTDAGVFSRDSVDFGSRTLLATFLNNTTGDFDQLLDLGCGYGAMGLALATAYPKAQIDMVDVSQRALTLAESNAQANQITNAAIFFSDVYSEIDKTDYDHVLSNPPIRAGKEVVHGIISGAKDHLKLGGRLTIVIQKKQGAPSAKKKMAELYGNVTELDRKKGYWILQSYKQD